MLRHDSPSRFWCNLDRSRDLNLTVIDHPLARHSLTVLRDKSTDSQDFRNAAKRLTYALVMEATTRVPLRKFEIETPLEKTAGYALGDIVAVAVLRAGLGLLDAVLELMPDVKVGFAGVQRDEETALPQEYYAKMPPWRGRLSLSWNQCLPRVDRFLGPVRK